MDSYYKVYFKSSNNQSDRLHYHKLFCFDNVWMSKSVSALKTAALISTPGLFTWNMCTVCTAGKKITTQWCSALPTADQSHFTCSRFQPMTAGQPEHAQPIALSVDHWCNGDATDFYWTTKCAVNQIVPLQNNTTPHSKVGYSLRTVLVCVRVPRSPTSSLSAGCGRSFKRSRARHELRN